MAQTTPGQETKQALLVAAGELFANKGLDGASVRDIVKKAGTTLSSVNYHFGSKDQLYFEAIRYILSQRVRGIELLEEFTRKELKTPQEVSNALFRLLGELFLSYLTPDGPEWHGRLLNRAIIDFRAEVPTIFAEVIWPIHQSLKENLLRRVPHVSAHEADLWVIGVFAQIHHYLMAKDVIIWSLRREDYDEPFLQGVAAHIARNAVVVLGLPEPERPPTTISEPGRVAPTPSEPGRAGPFL
jgi:AcrR family transcriptional regulator